jgi:hypothetical protein
MVCRFARFSVPVLVILALTSAARAAGPAKAESPFQEEGAASASDLPSTPVAPQAPAGPPAADISCADNVIAGGGCSPGECGPCGPCGAGCWWAENWTVTADALLLFRGATHGPQLLTEPVSGSSLLNASDLGFSGEAGPRLSVIRHCCSCDLELNYFAIDGWRSGVDFPNSAFPNGLGSLTVDDTIRFPVSDVLFVDRSRLYNAELNLRRRVTDSLTLLAGVRWVDFEDDYLAEGTAGSSTPFSETVRAHNHLFGAQIGGDAFLLGHVGGLELHTVAKAGIFGDAAAQTTVFSNPPGLGPLSAAASGGHASFLGEIALLASYPLTKHATIRGGYEVMWIEGAALAPRQIPNTDLTSGIATLDASGGIFFNGATLGLDVTW